MSNVESNFALSVPSFVMLGAPVVLVLVFWFRELQFGVCPLALVSFSEWTYPWACGFTAHKLPCHQKCVGSV